VTDAAPAPALTYEPHGGSVRLDATDVPPGFRVFRHDAVIGSGQESWSSAADAVLQWALHRGAGIRVSTPRVSAGDDVVLTIPLLGCVTLTAHTRVITISDHY